MSPTLSKISTSKISACLSKDIKIREDSHGNSRVLEIRRKQRFTLYYNSNDVSKF